MEEKRKGTPSLQPGLRKSTTCSNTNGKNSLEVTLVLFNRRHIAKYTFILKH